MRRPATQARISKPPTRLEGQEQMAFTKAAAMRRWGQFYFHLPNERMDKIERFKLARQGVKKGLPDNWLIWPSIRWIGTSYIQGPGVNWEPLDFCGAICELKRENASRSQVKPEQMFWLKQLAGAGFACIVTKGFMDGVAFFEQYFASDPHFCLDGRFNFRTQYVRHPEHDRLWLPEGWV